MNDPIDDTTSETTNDTMNDAIVRQRVVAHPIERVWAAVTDAAELARWFGDEADVDLRPGGSIRFGWSQYDAVAVGTVLDVEPPFRLEFEWGKVAGDGAPPAPDELTTVSIGLLSQIATTVVTITESGLAKFDPDRRARIAAENSAGWEAELGDLDRYLRGGS